MFTLAPISRKPLSLGFSTSLQILFVLATLSVTVVHADEYADVNGLLRAGKLVEALAPSKLLKSEFLVRQRALFTMV